MSEPFVILFVCTGNTCRSPMAEGALTMLLSRLRPGKFDVMSAGTAAATGFPATMYAIEAAKIWDVDLSRHRSQPLTPALIERADLIFAMTPTHAQEILRVRRSAKHKTYLLKAFPDLSTVGDGVVDPIGLSLDEYNRTFLEIGEYLGKYLPAIVQRIDEKTNVR